LLPPEEYTRVAVREYEAITEQQLADAAYELAIADRHHPEIHMLYALRIAKPVSTLKSTTTLASRWKNACSGAGGQGLLRGKDSPNHALVRGFISQRCVDRLSILAQEIVAKAEETAAKRKTAATKRRVYDRAAEKLWPAMNVVDGKELAAEARRWIDHLKERAYEAGSTSE
jgi:hypothetical protein